MAGSTTNISIRMDSELKAQADALFNELGMNLSTAFNIFVRQSLRGYRSASRWTRRIRKRSRRCARRKGSRKTRP